MESGDGVRVKTAIPEECGQLTSCPYEGVNLAPLSRLSTESRGGVLMDSSVTKKMKIIQFPVNIDKLTGFFDKYLKSEGEGIEVIIEYISVSYEDRFKQKMNILSKFIE